MFIGYRNVLNKKQDGTTKLESKQLQKSQWHKKCHVTHLFLPHLPQGKDTVCSWTSALIAAQLFYWGQLWNSAVWATSAWMWPWAPIWFEWWRVVYSLWWSQGRPVVVWATAPSVVNMAENLTTSYVCQVKSSITHRHPASSFFLVFFFNNWSISHNSLNSCIFSLAKSQLDVYLCSWVCTSSHFCPNILYLGSHSECQRCTGDSGAVGYRSQHQAGLSQELTGEGLQDRGPWLHGFGGCSGGRQVGGWLGVELRSYNGESLRHRGDCTVEHFLPGFFHLS